MQIFKIVDRLEWFMMLTGLLDGGLNELALDLDWIIIIFLVCLFDLWGFLFLAVVRILNVNSSIRSLHAGGQEGILALTVKA